MMSYNPLVKRLLYLEVEEIWQTKKDLTKVGPSLH